MFHGYKLGQQSTDDNDNLHRGQRSTKVKCGNQYMATTFGQLRCTIIQAEDDDDLHED